MSDIDDLNGGSAPEEEFLEQSNTETQEGTGQSAEPQADDLQRGEPETETTGTRTEQRKPSGAQDRIQQLISQRKQAEDQAAFWQRRAESLQPKPAGNEVDHPDDASWRKAVIQESITEAQRAAAEAQAREAAHYAHQARTQAFEERARAFGEKAADFDQVARNPNVVITNEMGFAIKESDMGPQVAYWLGKNPNEAARIAGMHPLLQAKEIGRLEARLSTPAKRITQAPTPVRTVSSGSGAGAFDADKAEMEDYYRHRMAQK